MKTEFSSNQFTFIQTEVEFRDINVHYQNLQDV